jgi:hypothetical protein
MISAASDTLSDPERTWENAHTSGLEAAKAGIATDYLMDDGDSQDSARIDGLWALACRADQGADVEFDGWGDALRYYPFVFDCGLAAGVRTY